MSEEMPRNLVGDERANVRDDAAKEAEWLANNVPAERLELHWRYENKNIQLFERHLRSLPAYGIGPALISYLRTRLEWLKDNKVWERPSGIVVVTVDPNGEADAYLADAQPAPELTADNVFDAEGSVWAYFEEAGELVVVPAPNQLRGASETLTRDLAKTLGYTMVSRSLTPADLDGAQVAHVSDEFGFVALPGHEGAFTVKMQQCFEKLWSN